MIGSLHGRLAAKHASQIIVECSGVGYEVETPMSTFLELPEIGTDVFLHTHLLVREDAQILYGFATADERSLFRTLLKVNRVGEADGELAAAELGVNLLAPIRLSARLLPLLLAADRAALVNVSSALAIAPSPRSPVYAASKAGIIGLTLSAAASYAGNQLRFNAVAPGLTETPLTQSLTANESARKFSEAMHALGRLGHAVQAQQAVVLLGVHGPVGHLQGGGLAAREVQRQRFLGQQVRNCEIACFQSDHAHEFGGQRR